MKITIHCLNCSGYYEIEGSISVRLNGLLADAAVCPDCGKPRNEVFYKALQDERFYRCEVCKTPIGLKVHRKRRKRRVRYCQLDYMILYRKRVKLLKKKK